MDPPVRLVDPEEHTFHSLLGTLLLGFLEFHLFVLSRIQSSTPAAGHPRESSLAQPDLV